jgi:hypothetical protein
MLFGKWTFWLLIDAGHAIDFGSAGCGQMVEKLFLTRLQAVKT